MYFKLAKVTIIILSLLFIQSCSETYDECLRRAIKESPTKIALKFAAIECIQEHPEHFKNKKKK